MIGVLALQGAARAHCRHLDTLGVAHREVRTPADLFGLDGLVLPGGESTTMSNLLLSSGVAEPLRELIADGLPVLATCAGLILLASEVLDGRPDQLHLGALDVTVQRNGYGRQLNSFETELDITGLDAPFHGVFIRAPRIEAVSSPGALEELAEFDGDPVLVRQGSIVAATFHPELADDVRLHAMFLEATD